MAGGLSLISGGIAQSQKAKAREMLVGWPLQALLRKAALQTDLHPEGTCRQLQLSRDTMEKASRKHSLDNAALLCVSSHATRRAGVQPAGHSGRSGSSRKARHWRHRDVPE